MKHIIAIALLAAMPAYAQEAGSNSVSQSGLQSDINVWSGVQSYGAPVPDSTTATINNVPGGVVGPGFSGGHPCAYAPISAGLSVVGAGASLGGQIVDDACLLAQMGESAAALRMIAARSPSACKALRSAGRISSESQCDAQERRLVRRDGTVASNAPDRSPRPVARPADLTPLPELKVKCVRNGNRITPQVTAAVAAAYNANQIADACR